LEDEFPGNPGRRLGDSLRSALVDGNVVWLGGVTDAIQPLYDSAVRKPSILLDVRDLVRFRGLLLLLISNLSKTRYKRSVLGIGWTLVNPLLNMAVLTFAFSQIFRFSVQHYAVYVLIGIIFWNFLSQTTIFAMNSLVSGSSLLRRMYLPRSIFAVASIGNGVVNLAIAMVPLVVIMVVTGHPLHPTWWFLPLATLLLAMFSLGIALLVSALAVFFADVVEMYGILLQAWFFLTPVMYPKAILPARFAALMKLNPAFQLLELFRVPLFDGKIPSLTMIAAATFSAVAMLVVGWWIFARKADEFAYRL
jgi:ABC-2 type transport system permease protein